VPPLRRRVAARTSAALGPLAQALAHANVDLRAEEVALLASEDEARGSNESHPRTCNLIEPLPLSEAVIWQSPAQKGSRTRYAQPAAIESSWVVLAPIDE
jgi:hypothetical protein